MKVQPHSQIDLRTARLSRVKNFSFLQNLSETWPGKCESGSSKTGMPEVVLPVPLGCKPSSVHHLPEITLAETLEHAVNSLLCVLFIWEGSKTETRWNVGEGLSEDIELKLNLELDSWEERRIWTGTKEDRKRGFLREKTWMHTDSEQEGVWHIY